MLDAMEADSKPSYSARYDLIEQANEALERHVHDNVPILDDELLEVLLELYRHTHLLLRRQSMPVILLADKSI